jgi:hypothetical protein
MARLRASAGLQMGLAAPVPFSQAVGSQKPSIEFVWWSGFIT